MQSTVILINSSVNYPSFLPSSYTMLKRLKISDFTIQHPDFLTTNTVAKLCRVTFISVVKYKADKSLLFLPIFCIWYCFKLDT